MGDLRAAVEGAGYSVPEASPGEDPVARQERVQREEERALLSRLRVGVLLGVPLFLLSHWEMIAGHGSLPFSPFSAAPLQFLLATPIQFHVGARFYRGAWVVARHGSTDMNTLVALGTSVAYLYSGIAVFLPSLVTAEGLVVHLYFETSAAIIVLVLLGRYFESRARGRTSEAVKKLIGLVPKTARVVRDGAEVDVPLESVVVGEDEISGQVAGALARARRERALRARRFRHPVLADRAYGICFQISLTFVSIEFVVCRKMDERHTEFGRRFCQKLRAMRVDQKSYGRIRLGCVHIVVRRAVDDHIRLMRFDIRKDRGPI